MKGLPSTEWSDRIESNPICFHCELFQCRSIRDHSRLTSTSDVPFSAPLRHVRWTRVRKRERNGLQIAFAIETNTAKWSLSHSLPLSRSLSAHLAIDRAWKRINRESMTSWNSYVTRLLCLCFSLLSPRLRFVNQGRVSHDDASSDTSRWITSQ